MNRRQKDNFTDATEAFQHNDDGVSSAKPDSGGKKEPQQVRDNEGNLVTLGQTAQNHPHSPNKENPIELSPEELEAIITKAVKAGVADALDRFTKKLEDKK